MTTQNKRDLLTKAIQNYKEMLQNLDKMEKLVVDHAAHPDAKDEETMLAALHLAKHRAAARTMRRQLKDAVNRYGTFNQRAWLDNN